MSTKSSRPTTPSLKLSAMAGRGGPSQPGPVGAAIMDPASPPQTPTSVSPLLNHGQPVAAIGQFPLYQNFARPSVRQGSNIRPVGNGHQFSYRRAPHVNPFAQLSPQSSSEDEEEEEEEEESQSESDSSRSRVPQSLDEDEDEDEDDEDESEDETPSLVQPRPQRAPVVDSSSEEDDDDDDAESSDDDEELQPPRRGQPTGAVGSARDIAVASFVLEEMSDFDPMNDNRSDIMQPTGIESPNSQRARSLSHGAASDSDNHSHHDPPPVQVHIAHLAHRPRRAVPHPDDPDSDHIPDLDRGMSNLNCTPEAEDDDDDDEVYEEDAETAAFAAAQRELRMRKRRSHGSSIGKRTHSERSDSDGEKDWTPLGDDVDVLGGSARRLRRRVGDRRSLLTFQDPPPERIEELEEPDSCAEDGWRNSIGVTRGSGSMFGEGDALRELPYWDLEIMEVDDDRNDIL